MSSLTIIKGCLSKIKIAGFETRNFKIRGLFL